MKKHPYVRIMEAAKQGKGVLLDPQEVFDMSLDDAIATHAARVLDAADRSIVIQKETP